MGNDGGSFSHRAEMVKEKPKEKKPDPTIEAHNKSRICSISSQNLTKPIVADRIGNMFNQDVVYEALVNKNMPRAYCYIRKTKDVKILNAVTKQADVDKIDNDGNNLIICPISGKEFDGFQKFTLIWSCGCVISSSVFTNMNVNNECPNCNQPFKEKDKVNLNPDPKLAEGNRQRLVEKFVIRKRDKKAIEINKEQEVESKSRYEEQKLGKIDAEAFLIEEQEVKKQKLKFKAHQAQSKLVKNSQLNQKIDERLQKDNTIKTLFDDQHKEVIGNDFLCRSGYGA
jgi:hypothetical protein